jgi:hypothetical protein
MSGVRQRSTLHPWGARHDRDRDRVHATSTERERPVIASSARPRAAALIVTAALALSACAPAEDTAGAAPGEPTPMGTADAPRGVADPHAGGQQEDPSPNDARGGEGLDAPAQVDAATLDEQVCQIRESDLRLADQLLEGTYHWSPHEPVDLGTDIDWDEDPFEDPNWQFQLHALRWTWALVGATEATGDDAYLERALEIAEDWSAQNPVEDPVVPVAWDDHAAAWRALVLTCLSLRTDEQPDWLDEALALHRVMLADPDFYVEDKGNHALNQDIGMLAIACLTGEEEHQELALERIETLVTQGVDEQGVMDEQAVEYQDYNYERYDAALDLLTACGLEAPDALDRVELMPEVLAHMTLPDSTYVTIGDTDRRDAKRLEHPATIFTSSAGEEGTPPRQTFVVYDAGFAFARSGWGEHRDLADERMISVRFGPRPQLHGHDDHGSVTLYAEGQQLLVDPGKYVYADVDERHHVLSREAHNVVDVDDCEPSDLPSLARDVDSDRWTDRLTIEVALCEGVVWERTVVFVRETGELVVVDDLDGSDGRPLQQWWQLELEASVDHLAPQLVAASWPSGASLLIEQLDAVTDVASVAGGENPLRGWVSPAYGELEAAEHLEFTATPDAARFVTVFRPGAEAGADPSSLQVDDDVLAISLTTSEGDRLTITVDR